MFKPVRTVPPENLPVDVVTAKAMLAITDSDRDVVIDALIGAVTARLDGWSGILGRALVTQTWRQDFSCFADRMDLPLAPVQSIGSITYVDGDGATQTLSSSVYELLADARGAYVGRRSGESWPSIGDVAAPVSITFVAGYGDSIDVPADIRHAIILMVGTLYAHARSDAMLTRETVQGVGTQEWAGGADMLKAIDGLAASFLANHRRVGV